MFEKFAVFFDEKLSGPATKLSEQRHLKAIRDGIIAVLPLIVVGSIYLVIALAPLPENWAIKQFISEHAQTILLPYRVTMYIMALYASWGIGYSLSKSYKLDPLTGSIMAAMSYLLTFMPVLTKTGLALPINNMGGGGMFIAILTSILGVEIYRICEKSKFKIKMPDAVPTSVTRSFQALVPTAVIMLVIGSLTYYIGFDWHSTIGKLVAPLISASDTLSSALGLTFIGQLFWSLGIHGASIVGAVARPIFLTILDSNAAQFAAGQPVTGMLTEPFSQWFVAIGGAGSTLALCILMVFRAKSVYFKTLGKAVFTASIFNINEPVLYGLPIVMNPILIIPFMIAPMVLTITTWFAMSFGLVNKIVLMAPWTLPGPIGAYLSTGMDPRAIILHLINLVIAIAIYYPFFKLQDKQLVEEEHALELELKVEKCTK